jgi:uncharacterized protein (DUF58 family)
VSDSIQVKEGLSEILKRVRRIEIKTRRLSQQLFAGEYASTFKGRGMAFSEVREYQIGDDIRTIDWNVTARFNHPYVKIFEEERELTVMLIIDVSASNFFGSVERFKIDLVTEIAAILAFSTIQNNDKIGVIFFSDRIERFIPPKKGKSHVLRIIRDLIEFKPEKHKTDIGLALKYFTNVIKKHCTAFIISDFDDPNNFRDALTIANKKHEVYGLRVFDKREENIPSLGFIPVRDPETATVQWVDTSSKTFREKYRQNAITQRSRLTNIFARSGVVWSEVVNGEDYVKPLMKLFKSK